MLDTIIHSWLRAPYTLHVTYRQNPKKAVATILFIHGLGNTGAAWKKVIERLPGNVRIISIDLLGFGNSPKPDRAEYNAKTQARSVLATYLKLGIRTPVILVGHSMGALVAIEMAKRYPLLVKQMILCSPPIYSDRVTRLPHGETLRKKMFKTAQDYPEQLMRLSALGLKYKLVNESFNLTKDNIDSYLSALNSAVINQTAMNDAMQIKVPTTIIKPTLDPFIVAKNYAKLKKRNPYITVKTVIAGHEVMGSYVTAIANEIHGTLHRKNKSGIIDR